MVFKNIVLMSLFILKLWAWGKPSYSFFGFCVCSFKNFIELGRLWVVLVLLKSIFCFTYFLTWIVKLVAIHFFHFAQRCRVNFVIVVIFTFSFGLDSWIFDIVIWIFLGILLWSVRRCCFIVLSKLCVNKFLFLP